MRVLTDARWLPKAGNARDEYEDACWPAGVGRGDGRAPFRCAIADGATETSFAGCWAEALVAAFGAGRFDAEGLPGALPALQRAWRERVGARPLPWYAEEKLRSGAFAAFLGLTIAAPAPGEAGGAWEAVAVGDSCLFALRGERLLGAFPLAAPEEFDRRPTLIASEPAGNGAIAASIERAGGAWESGDEFVLLTDALARWFLAAPELGGAPWTALRALTPGADGADAADADLDEGFAAWIAGLRRAGDLRNDDVTLLRAVVHADPAPALATAEDRCDAGGEPPAGG